MKRAFAVAVLATISVSSIAQQIYTERKDQDHWFRTIIVPKPQLTVTGTERLSRDFLSEVTKAAVQLAVLSIFVSREDVAIARFENRDSYKQWMVFYTRAAQAAHPTAEMVSVNGNAVLRVQDINGRETEKSLAGNNPLRFELDGASFEVLVINSRPAAPLDACKPSLSMSVYVKSSAPLDLKKTDDATREIAGLFRSKSIVTNFRNDTWFISFGGFPVIYPFSTDTTPPTEDAYNASRAFTCYLSCQSEGPACTQVLGK